MALALLTAPDGRSRPEAEARSAERPAAPAERRAASVFVAVGGSDRGSCSRSAPCATFDRAYRVAAPGAVVEVAGGTYPSQSLEFDPRKASGPKVVFRPAAGASVTLAEFVTGESKRRVGARRFELRDMAVSSYVRLRWGSGDVVLRNIDAGGLNLTSVSGVQVLGGDYGPMVDGVSHINGCGVAGCSAAEDILIDGAYFHDYTVTDPAKHSECLMIWPGRRITIRNSTFRNCTDFDLLVKPYQTSLLGLPGEIVLENNLFDEPMPGESATAQCNPGCPRSGNAIAITQGGGESWGNVQIRYNSSLGGFRIDPSITNTVISGNIGRKDSNFACQRNASFSYNIWNGASCSATDRRASFAKVFEEPTSARFDLRLRRGSSAIGAGDPNRAPARDVAGRIRPKRLAADAGAWQREPALVLPGQALGSVKLRMPRAEVVSWYGEPRRRTFVDGPKAGQKVEIASHRVRGGWLRVHLLEGRVVAVSTTTPFYRTRRELGPGVPLRPRSSNEPQCRRIGSAGLYVTPARQGKRTVVQELTISVGGYTPPCARPSGR